MTAWDNRVNTKIDIGVDWVYIVGVSVWKGFILERAYYGF